MEVAARLKFARMSPQKCRLVCDQIRGKSIEHAIDILKFSPKDIAAKILKLLNSGIANAEHNNGADIDELKVKTVFVDQGPTFKRMHAKAKGRGSSILKPTSHVTIILSDEE